MSLKNIKSNSQAQKGFTIVELLIVVVVIAILAAITIVSYNGITSRANASASKSTAATVQKKAELFAADGTTGTYPALVTNLTTDQSATWALPTGVASITAPTPTNGKTVVQYQVCGRSATAAAPVAPATNIVGITGARIQFWNYDTAALDFVNLGVSQGGTVVIGATTHAIACFAPAS